jgi:hypothetical protein
MLAGTKRHPLQAEYRLGCNRQGVLEALDCRLLFDTGAYAGMGDVVLALAMEHAGGPYRIPNVRIDGRAVYTNNPVSSAFRGFGVPQVAAAMEQAMDELAQAGGFDPWSCGGKMRSAAAIARQPEFFCRGLRALPIVWKKWRTIPYGRDVMSGSPALRRLSAVASASPRPATGLALDRLSPIMRTLNWKFRPTAASKYARE